MKRTNHERETKVKKNKPKAEKEGIFEENN